MSRQGSKSPLKKVEHILHTLNFSKTKTVFSFEKSGRFPELKSHSPNKFYDLPSGLKRTGCSLGSGGRTKFEKPDFVGPTRYTITSQFDLKHKRSNSDTFGISRDSYYRGKEDKNKVGPGAYNLPREISSKSIYIGKKLATSYDIERSPSQLNITNANLSQLSTMRNDPTPVRLKTDYYPKPMLYEYDNKVPGPGTYFKDSATRTPQKSTLTTFGATERLKAGKTSALGPGRYNAFSEFGMGQ